MPAHILVVDNDAPTVEMIALVLEDAGYVVRTALTPAAARTAIVEQRPDLVLLDYHIPGITGVDLAHALRSEGLRDVPILVMTVDTRIANARSLAGIDFCLAKPFDIDTLINCVAQHLQLRQKRTTEVAELIERIPEEETQ